MDIDIDINLDPRLREISQVDVAPTPSLVLPVMPSPASTLRLFPPPLFSRQTIPQGYKCVPSSCLACGGWLTRGQLQGKHGVDAVDRSGRRNGRGA